MAQITKVYDDMDNVVLSQTGTKKSKCKTCRKGQQEVLVDHFVLSVRFVSSCSLTDKMQESEDPKVRLLARQQYDKMKEIEREGLPMTQLSVENFAKFVDSMNGLTRDELEALGMTQLKVLAKKHGIKGRSREDLINSLTGK